MSKYDRAYLQQYLIDMLSIQLFVTLISLPVLIAWGLPLSLFSILGNMLFSPILTMYIFVCSLLFLCALCNITCAPLNQALDLLSSAWLTILNYIPDTAHVGFAQPPAFVLASLGIATLLILHAKQLSKKNKCILYGLLFAIALGASELYQKTAHTLIDIPCFNGSVHFIVTHGTTTVVDTGYMGQRISAPSWAEYTLLPAITKQTGHTHIDQIITLCPNRFTLTALETLCKKNVVKKIYLPLWQGENSYKLHRAFMALKKTCAENHCRLIRIGKNQAYTLNAPENIQLTSYDSMIEKNGISFVNAHVSGHIDNKAFSFYASKHKKTRLS